MKQQETINYLTYDQALELVDRISKRAGEFNHVMQENEKEAMAQLLSYIGVTTSDLIDVSNLADNYAINCEFTNSGDDNYTKEAKSDSLFSWHDDDDDDLIYFCLSW